MGEARETLACLHTALAVGYIGSIAPSLQGKLDQIIGTLVNLLR